MSTKISITVEAESIGELASKLAQLHGQFRTIASQMTQTGETPSVKDAPQAPTDSVVVREVVQTQPAAPPAVDAEKQQGVEAQTPGRGRGRKTAAEKAKGPPQDRFFEDDAAEQTPPASTPLETAIADAAPADASYLADLTDDQAYALLRALAKRVLDDNGPDGPEKLRTVWNTHWATICPDDAAGPPKVGKLEGKRDRIVAFIRIFETFHGIDPVTGEDALPDPVNDLL